MQVRRPKCDVSIYRAGNPAAAMKTNLAERVIELYNAGIDKADMEVNIIEEAIEKIQFLLAIGETAEKSDGIVNSRLSFGLFR